jgi:hypothetical protein
MEAAGARLVPYKVKPLHLAVADIGNGYVLVAGPEGGRRYAGWDFQSEDWEELYEGHPVPVRGNLPPDDDPRHRHADSVYAK